MRVITYLMVRLLTFCRPSVTESKIVLMLLLCHDAEALQGHLTANSYSYGLGVESVLCVRLQHFPIFVPVNRPPHEYRITGCF